MAPRKGIRHLTAPSVVAGWCPRTSFVLPTARNQTNLRPSYGVPDTSRSRPSVPRSQNEVCANPGPQLGRSIGHQSGKSSPTEGMSWGRRERRSKSPENRSIRIARLVPGDNGRRPIGVEKARRQTGLIDNADADSHLRKRKLSVSQGTSALQGRDSPMRSSGRLHRRECPRCSRDAEGDRLARSKGSAHDNET
jgi:hypothetical protein